MYDRTREQSTVFGVKPRLWELQLGCPHRLVVILAKVTPRLSAAQISLFASQRHSVQPIALFRLQLITADALDVLVRLGYHQGVSHSRKA